MIGIMTATDWRSIADADHNGLKKSQSNGNAQDQSDISEVARRPPA
jgi:hypothetical protein